MNERLMDVEKTLAYLGGVSERMLESWVKHGHLRPVGLPNAANDGTIRRMLFDVKDLDALIDRAKEESCEARVMSSSEAKSGTLQTSHSESKPSLQTRKTRKKHSDNYDPVIAKLERDYHLTPQR